MSSPHLYDWIKQRRLLISVRVELDIFNGKFDDKQVFYRSKLGKNVAELDQSCGQTRMMMTSDPTDLKGLMS